MTLLFNPGRKRKMVFGILFSIFSLVSAENISRVDFFDASKNHLMFITFEYEGSTNTAYSVFMSDSTFTRRVVLSKNDGKNEKAVSFDFNEDTSFISKFTYSDENTEMTLKDQFSNEQLGGKVNFKESGDSYELSQNSETFGKISYEKDGSGNYNRINVTDESGTLMYYATLSTTGIANSKSIQKSGNLAALRSKGNNCFELKFNLQKSATVSCDLYSLSGRTVAKFFNKDVVAGSSKETVRISKGSIANGIYLMSLTVNGRKVLNEKILIQGFTGGF